MKINVDVAISKNLGRASVTAIAWNSSGFFLGVSAMVTDGITDLEIMEAIACREGLALVSDLALQKFQLASNNANMIRSLQVVNLEAYGQILQEMTARSKEFRKRDFVHESRMSNVDAHHIAGSNISGDIGRHIRLLSSPDDVCSAHVQVDQ